MVKLQMMQVIKTKSIVFNQQAWKLQFKMIWNW